MPRNLMTTRRAVPGWWVLLPIALSGWGCGATSGTTGYGNPITTTRAPAILDAQTLAQWMDEGKVNAPFGVADRVVVVSVTTRANFTSPAKKHIPESVMLDYSAELTMTREEGLGPAGTMMLSGPPMNALVKRLGIDDHTTIVLTIPRASTDSEQLQQAVALWTFRYWGFARERVKILNGGDDAWEAAGQPLTDAIVTVTPSTYNLTSNKTVKHQMRHSIGEMLTLVDTLNRDPSQRATWQLLDVRGYTTSPYIANAQRGNGAWQFVLDRVNGESARNRLYPDRETLLARLASLAVMDGPNATFLSATKRTISMCGSSTNSAPTFVLFDAVLGVPEGDIAMYDGSSSQWNNYSYARIRSAGATETQAGAWSFDVATSGTAFLRSVGPLPAPVPGENPFVTGYFAFSPTQQEANQIETSDAQFMSGAAGGGAPVTPATPKPPGSGC